MAQLRLLYDYILRYSWWVLLAPAFKNLYRKDDLLSVVSVFHHSDIIMRTMASQITSLTIAYSTVCSGADQRKHQSSASLAFVRRIHRHKEPVTRKMFPFDDVIMHCVGELGRRQSEKSFHMHRAYASSSPCTGQGLAQPQKKTSPELLAKGVPYNIVFFRTVL